MAPSADRNHAASGPGSAQNRRGALLSWLGVVCGFLLLASAWFFLIRAAQEAKVESVPLATQGGRP
jgi:hypothetical protein